MNLLLDTCALIWAVTAPEKLSKNAQNKLTAPDTIIYYSPISSAEIACLVDRKRISITIHWKTWFNKYINENGWQAKNITLDIAQEAYSLPGDFHADPVDRLIVATARIHKLCIVTGDQKILQYPHINAIN